MSATTTPFYKKPAGQAAIAGVAVAALVGGILYMEADAKSDERDLALQMCQQRVEAEARYGGIEYGTMTERQDGNLYRFAGNVDLNNGYGVTEPFRFSCVIDPYGRALDDEVSLNPR